MPAGAAFERALHASAAAVELRGTQSVPAVEKVFAILEVLARSSHGLTLRELADVCGVPKSTVHCIVVTLQRCGYLHRNHRTSRYLFGRKLLLLANTAIGGLDLREQAEPWLRALARRTRLPVHMAIVEFDEAVVVARADFAGGVRSPIYRLGQRLELHCTGAGKALVSGWSEADLERLVRERPLARHNENTIGTLRRLREALAAVRRTGYALDDEEDALGFRSVGAPVTGPDGKVPAAIAVRGAVHELADETVAALGQEVSRAAGAFGRAIRTC